MNRVLLTGRLTRDPEMRSLASGKTVTQFSVATNDYRGGQEKSEFHTVVTWVSCPLRRTSKSGEKLYVVGSLHPERW
jgi:single-strand DNA-binding protein